MTVSSLTPVKHRLRVYNTELLQELVQPSKPVHFQEVMEAWRPLMLAHCCHLASQQVLHVLSQWHLRVMGLLSCTHDCSSLRRSRIAVAGTARRPHRICSRTRATASSGASPATSCRNGGESAAAQHPLRSGQCVMHIGQAAWHGASCTDPGGRADLQAAPSQQGLMPLADPAGSLTRHLQASNASPLCVPLQRAEQGGGADSQAATGDHAASDQTAGV